MAAETTMAALRRKLDLTQDEFAAMIGRTQTELSRYENMRRLNTELLPTIHAQFRALFKDDTMDDIEPMDLLRPWEETISRKALKSR